MKTKEPDGARPRMRHGQRFSCRTLSGVFGGGTRSESRQGGSALERRVSPRPARLVLPLVRRRRAVLRLAVGYPVTRFDDVCAVGEDGFRSMDRLEGYPSLYRREQIQVHLVGGGSVLAWVYIMNNLPKGAPVIESGDWVAYRKSKDGSTPTDGR